MIEMASKMSVRPKMFQAYAHLMLKVLFTKT